MGQALMQSQATCLAQISGYLGWVLPANTISLVIASLGPSPNAIWLGVSWTTGAAVGFALVGRLSDIFGRRWFFTSVTVMALIGNIIGASAQSVNMLIVSLLLLYTYLFVVNPYATGYKRHQRPSSSGPTLLLRRHQRARTRQGPRPLERRGSHNFDAFCCFWTADSARNV